MEPATAPEVGILTLRPATAWNFYTFGSTDQNVCNGCGKKACYTQKEGKLGKEIYKDENGGLSEVCG